MEPVTIIATAVALGALEGASATARQAVSDAYLAIRKLISDKSAAVDPEVSVLAKKPSDKARREMLVEALEESGAGDDQQLRDLAQKLLAAVEAGDSDAPDTVGVVLRRASAGGDIEVTDIKVDGGSGVVAEDVSAAGSIKFQGVAARAPQEPPHPPVAREQ